MKTLMEFFAESAGFVEAFTVWAKLLAPQAKADHICYKCSDSTEFEHLRSLFEKESVFIYQSIISHRRIAIIKFFAPLKTPLGDISLLELSDQKPDNSQKSGWDHIEIYPVDQSLEHLVEYLEQNTATFTKVVRPHHTTYDATIFGDFNVRLEDEPLLDKIKREEMR